jgi:hypothetical protein
VYAAALAAIPLIEKVAQGLASGIANGVASFAANDIQGANGQFSTTASAKSARSAAIQTLNQTLGPDATNAILTLQNGAVHGHHHHGHAGYKAAANLADNALTGVASGSGVPTASVTA